MRGSGKVYYSRIVYVGELDKTLNDMAAADHWWLERIVSLLTMGEKADGIHPLHGYPVVPAPEPLGGRGEGEPVGGDRGQGSER